MSENRLMRSSTDRIVAGVCGGLAEYLAVDSVYVRLAFILLLFASGIGLPIYLLLWFVMPEGDGEVAVTTLKSAEFGEASPSEGSRIGRPGTFGVVLILLGVYFLMSEIGLLDWFGSALFWSLLLIGGGVYLLVRRGRKSEL